MLRKMGKKVLLRDERPELWELWDQMNFEDFVEYFEGRGFRLPEYRSGDLPGNKIPEDVPAGWECKIVFLMGEHTMGPYSCPSRSTHAERDMIATRHGIIYWDRCVVTNRETGVGHEYKKVDDMYMADDGTIWRSKFIDPTAISKKKNKK